MHETTFESSDEWEFSPVAHDLWETLIDDSGLVTIQNPEQYGLHPGLETAVPGAAVYGVVFTHEYHCMVSPQRVPNAESLEGPQALIRVGIANDPKRARRADDAR